jgi:hypothetical protein
MPRSKFSPARVHELFVAELARRGVGCAFRAYVEPSLGWPVLATIPNRDFIYVIAEKDRGLLDYMGRVIQKEFRTSSYPISTEVLRISERGIEAIGAFPE